MRLSVIIPCYKAEKYIRQCLDSVFSITLPSTDFEVICFDDCAPDNTPFILDEYAIIHNNMRVVHSCANIGPGGGRNKASQMAQGKYIWYVDADDMIVPSVVLKLLMQAEKEQLDVLVFDYQDINEQKQPFDKEYRLMDSDVLNGREIGNLVFCGGLVNNMGYPVRFLIRRDYLLSNQIVFPEGMTYGEDTVWVAKVVLLAERIQASSKCAYLYWHHETSTCGQMRKVCPGKTIYERCVVTATQLLEFADYIRTKSGARWGEYAEEIESYTRHYYINQLPLLLCRSNIKERSNFYSLLEQSKYKHLIFGQTQLLTKLCLMPYVGRLLTKVSHFDFLSNTGVKHT